MKKSAVFRLSALLVALCLAFEQTGFAQVAASLDVSARLLSLQQKLAGEKFRPMHLRYLSYSPQRNDFRLLLDRGDNPQLVKPAHLKAQTKVLLEYFLVGVSVPQEAFWVNLRPDQPQEVIDPLLEETEVGRILLAADLQLKKDAAGLSSPQTPQGRAYWDALYRKAHEVYGTSAAQIPTMTRPWIVPDEVIVRESDDNAYVYKATLAVKLEQDYLKGDSAYQFKDPREKEINEYSAQLMRELIIPKLTAEVNTAQRYAPLRQVYYSLVLAQWFKEKYQGMSGVYPSLINSQRLEGLHSSSRWSTQEYFQRYKASFEKGEYDLKEAVSTPYGQVIRRYFSGGIALQSLLQVMRQMAVKVTGSPRRLPADPRMTVGATVEGSGDLKDPAALNVAVREGESLDMTDEENPADAFASVFWGGQGQVLRDGGAQYCNYILLRNPRDGRSALIHTGTVQNQAFARKTIEEGMRRIGAGNGSGTSGVEAAIFRPKDFDPRTEKESGMIEELHAGILKGMPGVVFLGVDRDASWGGAWQQVSFDVDKGIFSSIAEDGKTARSVDIHAIPPESAPGPKGALPVMDFTEMAARPLYSNDGQAYPLQVERTPQGQVRLSVQGRAGSLREAVVLEPVADGTGEAHYSLSIRESLRQELGPGAFRSLIVRLSSVVPVGGRLTLTDIPSEKFWATALGKDFLDLHFAVESTQKGANGYAVTLRMADDAEAMLMALKEASPDATMESGILPLDHVYVSVGGGKAYRGTLMGISGGSVAIERDDTTEYRVPLSQVRGIHRVSDDRLNERRPLATPRMVGHGTNAYALMRAAMGTNMQLRPASQLPRVPLTGENMGASSYNSRDVSVVHLSEQNSSTSKGWQYAHSNASDNAGDGKGGVLTLENIDGLIQQYTRLGQSGAWDSSEHARKAAMLKEAKEQLEEISRAGAYEEYLRLSHIPVLLVGDGVAPGRMKDSSISGEEMFRRMNIRVVAVEDAAAQAEVLRILGKSGVRDVLVLRKEELEKLLDEYKRSDGPSARIKFVPELVRRIKQAEGAAEKRQAAVKDFVRRLTQREGGVDLINVAAEIDNALRKARPLPEEVREVFGDASPSPEELQDLITRLRMARTWQVAKFDEGLQAQLPRDQEAEKETAILTREQVLPAVTLEPRAAQEDSLNAVEYAIQGPKGEAGSVFVQRELREMVVSVMFVAEQYRGQGYEESVLRNLFAAAQKQGLQLRIASVSSTAIWQAVERISSGQPVAVSAGKGEWAAPGTQEFSQAVSGLEKEGKGFSARIGPAPAPALQPVARASGRVRDLVRRVEGPVVLNGEQCTIRASEDPAYPTRFIVSSPALGDVGWFELRGDTEVLTVHIIVSENKIPNFTQILLRKLMETSAGNFEVDSIENPAIVTMLDRAMRTTGLAPLTVRYRVTSADAPGKELTLAEIDEYYLTRRTVESVDTPVGTFAVRDGKAVAAGERPLPADLLAQIEVREGKPWMKARSKSGFEIKYGPKYTVVAVVTPAAAGGRIASNMPAPAMDAVIARAQPVPQQAKVKSSALIELVRRLPANPWERAQLWWYSRTDNVEGLAALAQKVVAHSPFSDADRMMLGQAIGFMAQADIRAFRQDPSLPAVVSPEQYILGDGSRERNAIALIEGVFYVPQDAPANIRDLHRGMLAEALLHEALEAVTEEGNHAQLYQGIQRTIFGKENYLGMYLRAIIERASHDLQPPTAGARVLTSEEAARQLAQEQGAAGLVDSWGLNTLLELAQYAKEQSEKNVNMMVRNFDFSKEALFTIKELGANPQFQYLMALNGDIAKAQATAFLSRQARDDMEKKVGPFLRGLAPVKDLFEQGHCTVQQLREVIRLSGGNLPEMFGALQALAPLIRQGRMQELIDIAQQRLDRKKNYFALSFSDRSSDDFSWLRGYAALSPSALEQARAFLMEPEKEGDIRYISIHDDRKDRALGVLDGFLEAGVVTDGNFPAYLALSRSGYFDRETVLGWAKAIKGRPASASLLSPEHLSTLAQQLGGKVASMVVTTLVQFASEGNYDEQRMGAFISGLQAASGDKFGIALLGSQFLLQGQVDYRLMDVISEFLRTAEPGSVNFYRLYSYSREFAARAADIESAGEGQRPALLRTIARQVDARIERTNAQVARGIAPDEYGPYFAILAKLYGSSASGDLAEDIYELAQHLGVPVAGRPLDDIMADMDKAIATVGIDKERIDTFSFEARSIELSVPDDVERRTVELLGRALQVSPAAAEGIVKELAEAGKSVDEFLRKADARQLAEKGVPAGLLRQFSSARTPEDRARIMQDIRKSLYRSITMNEQQIITLISAVSERIGRAEIEAFVQGRASAQERNALFTKFREVDRYAQDFMQSLGAQELVDQLLRSDQWKVFKEFKQKLLENITIQQSQKKEIELVWKKKNLLTLFQGHYSGNCFGDYPYDMARPDILVTTILSDGELAGSLLFNIQGTRLVLIGFDPSESLVSGLEEAKKKELGDRIMASVYAFAAANGLELLLTEQAGGLSNRSLNERESLGDYLMDAYARFKTVQVEKRSYHPSYHYTVTAAEVAKPVAGTPAGKYMQAAPANAARAREIEGVVHGLYVRSPGARTIYVSRAGIEAQLRDPAQRRAFEALLGSGVTVQQVARFLDGHETLHALVDHVRGNGRILEISDDQEEYLADIFGKAFALGYGVLDKGVRDELGALSRALGIDLARQLKKAPEKIEMLFSRLGVEVTVDISKTPQELAALRAQYASVPVARGLRPDIGASLEARLGQLSDSVSHSSGYAETFAFLLAKEISAALALSPSELQVFGDALEEPDAAGLARRISDFVAVSQASFTFWSRGRELSAVSEMAQRNFFPAGIEDPKTGMLVARTLANLQGFSQGVLSRVTPMAKASDISRRPAAAYADTDFLRSGQLSRTMQRLAEGDAAARGELEALGYVVTTPGTMGPILEMITSLGFGGVQAQPYNRNFDLNISGSSTEAQRLGLVLTELSNNAIQHLRGSTTFFLARALVSGGVPGIEIVAVDNGPGLPSIRRMLEERDDKNEDNNSSTGDPTRGRGLTNVLDRATDAGLGYAEFQTASERTLFLPMDILPGLEFPNGAVHFQDKPLTKGTLIRLVRFISQPSLDAPAIFTAAGIPGEKVRALAAAMQEKAAERSLTMTEAVENGVRDAGVLVYVKEQLAGLERRGHRGRVASSDIRQEAQQGRRMAMFLDQVMSVLSHHHQQEFRRDGKTSYMVHILGVVSVYMGELGLRDPAAVIAAFFHDTLEDSIEYYPSGIRQGDPVITPNARMRIYRALQDKLLAEGLDAEFVNRVMAYVSAMSKAPEMDLMRAYYPGIVRLGPDAVALKLADRMYNLRDLAHTDPYFAERYIRDTFDQFIAGRLSDGKTFLEHAAPQVQARFLEVFRRVSAELEDAGVISFETGQKYLSVSMPAGETFDRRVPAPQYLKQLAGSLHAQDPREAARKLRDPAQRAALKADLLAAVNQEGPDPYPYSIDRHIRALMVSLGFDREGLGGIFYGGLQLGGPYRFTAIKDLGVQVGYARMRPGSGAFPNGVATDVEVKGFLDDAAADQVLDAIAMVAESMAARYREMGPDAIAFERAKQRIADAVSRARERNWKGFARAALPLIPSSQATAQLREAVAGIAAGRISLEGKGYEESGGIISGLGLPPEQKAVLIAMLNAHPDRAPQTLDVESIRTAVADSGEEAWPAIAKVILGQVPDTDTFGKLRAVLGYLADGSWSFAGTSFEDVERFIQGQGLPPDQAAVLGLALGMGWSQGKGKAPEVRITALPVGYALMGGTSNPRMAKELEKLIGMPQLALGPGVFPSDGDWPVAQIFAENVRTEAGRLFEEMRKAGAKKVRILVVGTGSGLDLMVAYYQAAIRGLSVEVDAIDINPTATLNTGVNVKLFQSTSGFPDDMVTIRKVTEGLEFVALEGKTYDLALFHAPNAGEFPRYAGRKDANIVIGENTFLRLMEGIRTHLEETGEAVVFYSENMRPALRKMFSTYLIDFMPRSSEGQDTQRHNGLPVREVAVMTHLQGTGPHTPAPDLAPQAKKPAPQPAVPAAAPVPPSTFVIGRPGVKWTMQGTIDNGRPRTVTFSSINPLNGRESRYSFTAEYFDPALDKRVGIKLYRAERTVTKMSMPDMMVYGWPVEGEPGKIEISGCYITPGYSDQGRTWESLRGESLLQPLLELYMSTFPGAVYVSPQARILRLIVTLQGMGFVPEVPAQPNAWYQPLSFVERMDPSLSVSERSADGKVMFANRDIRNWFYQAGAKAAYQYTEVDTMLGRRTPLYLGVRLVRHFGNGDKPAAGGRQDAAAATVTGTDMGPGGIDLRALPLVRQAVPASSMPAFSGNAGPVLLDQELLQMQQMVRGGVAPSAQRIKEYLAGAAASDEYARKMDGALVCLAEMLRAEEDRAEPTQENVRQLLGLVDSGIAPQNLLASLAGVAVEEKEPQKLEE